MLDVWDLLGHGDDSLLLLWLLLWLLLRLSQSHCHRSHGRQHVRSHGYQNHRWLDPRDVLLWRTLILAVVREPDSEFPDRGEGDFHFGWNMLCADAYVWVRVSAVR